MVLPLQAVVAGWVLRSALRLEARPLLLNLLLAGFGSLIALCGWYFLLVGVIGIAIGNLLYLLAGLLVAPAALVGDARGPGNTRRELAPRATGAGARALGGVLFVTVAAAAGYAAIPAPEAQTLGPSNQPALSCPQGEEIAAFEGSGDKVTPAFEATGSSWGYEFASPWATALSG